MIEIRAEQASDAGAIREILESAFESPAEAGLVEALRQQADPFVALVAVDGAEIVGHILFTPVTIGDHREMNALGLAPMAVAPDHQRSGIGSSLVQAGLDNCRDLGCGAVVVLGHPEYYPRFGFVPASRFGLGSEYDVPDEVFMAQELRPGFLDQVSGTVRYHPAFAEI